jgi:hypothetical protein
MTTEVQALLEERRACLERGFADRVAEVDAELARFGVVVEDEVVETATAGPAETTSPKRRTRKPA